jgi:hypothetical protein
MLSVRTAGWPTGFEPVLRGPQPRVLAVYTTATMRGGDDRTRTGGLSPDKRALCSSELRPRTPGGRGKATTSLPGSA